MQALQVPGMNLRSVTCWLDTCPNVLLPLVLKVQICEMGAVTMLLGQMRRGSDGQQGESLTAGKGWPTRWLILFQTLTWVLFGHCMVFLNGLNLHPVGGYPGSFLDPLQTYTTTRRCRVHLTLITAIVAEKLSGYKAGNGTGRVCFVRTVLMFLPRERTHG